MAGRVTLAHGSGGRASHELLAFMVQAMGGEALPPFEDAALLPLAGSRLVVSTDSFVVDPLFFPGGDIGALAVHGTVNDLAMRGARPLYLTLGLILEEGFGLDLLGRILASVREAAAGSGVRLVAGDTKVVPAGKADKIFINTTGIGVPLSGAPPLSCADARPGDVLILSGSMADHGVTVLGQRQGFALSGDLRSDTAPLHRLVEEMVAVAGQALHVLRDPTRGGVGTTLNELAQASGVGIEVEEGAVPVRESVRGACELLGLDPFYLANEGKLLALVAPERAGEVLAVMRRSETGAEAAIIGRAVAEHPGRVMLRTAVGGSRFLDMLHGEPLPRIC